MSVPHKAIAAYEILEKVKQLIHEEQGTIPSNRQIGGVKIEFPIKRENFSAVTQLKDLYRNASKVQRAQMRSWMQRVLTGEDGKP